MKLDAVAAFAEKLPGVTIGAQWGNKTWMVGDRGFALERPFSKADLARFDDETPPAGHILAVMVENLDAKDALLAMDLPGFFTIPHFNGYAAVLIELRRARASDVLAVVATAHLLVLNAPPKRARSTKKPRSRA